MSELYNIIDNFIQKYRLYLGVGQEPPKGAMVQNSKRGAKFVEITPHVKKVKVTGQSRKKKEKPTPENDPFYIHNFSLLSDIYTDPKTSDDVKKSIEDKLVAIGGDVSVLKEYFKNPKATWTKYVLMATTIRPQLEQKSTEALQRYVNEHGVMGDVTKPIFSVAGSPINCRPSKDCAKFCYAFGGTSKKQAAFTIVKKGEIIDILANRDPEWLADKIAGEFKKGKSKVNLFKQDKALRFFDRGEGSDAWIKVINRVNKHGIRAHVFSKRPEFLDKIDKKNVRLLSIDASNFKVAEGNTLPIAFVYSGEQDLQGLEHLKDRIQVVLPIKGTDAPKEQILDSLPDWTKSYVCPVDAGGKATGTIRDYRSRGELTGDKKKWNCPNCDVGSKGLGCYRGQTTQHGMFDDVLGKSEPSQKVANPVQLTKQINDFICKYVN